MSRPFFLPVVVIVLLAVPAPAASQDPQPYLIGEAGGSFGDGGAAPGVALGFGYLAPRNVGFEIEVTYVPSLELGDPGWPRIAIFPPIRLDVSGRLVGLQTHVVGFLPGGGTKLRAFVLAGGGVADLQQRVRVLGSGLMPEPAPGGLSILTRDAITGTVVSETSLLLSGGAGFEYALTRGLGLGVSIRYQRLFSDPRPLDMARVGLRATWRF